MTSSLEERAPAPAPARHLRARRSPALLLLRRRQPPVARAPGRLLGHPAPPTLQETSPHRAQAPRLLPPGPPGPPLRPQLRRHPLREAPANANAAPIPRSPLSPSAANGTTAYTIALTRGKSSAFSLFYGSRSATFLNTVKYVQVL